MFTMLKHDYPHHFIILNKSKDEVEITKNSEFGKFIISKFEEKSAIGQLFYSSKIIESSATYRGKTLFNVELQRSELLLNSLYKDKDSSSHLFWKTVIYELNNALNAEYFAEIGRKKDLSVEAFAKEIIEVEYNSILNTKKDYQTYWKGFCEKNSIKIYSRRLYFEDGTSFYNWYESLKKTIGGRRYINRYIKNKVVLEKKFNEMLLFIERKEKKQRGRQLSFE